MAMRVITADSNKCPACGNNLVFSAEEQVLTCSFCGGAYSPEKIDLLSQINSYDCDEADETEEDKHEVVCNACGATIVADNNTTASFCAFCGSPSVITQRLTKKFRPDFVIPFKLTREEALNKMREFAGSRRYVPKNFFRDDNIKKISGVYVPFWLMDSRCEMHTHAVGYREDLRRKAKYSVVSDLNIKFRNVPFDSAVKMKDDLMESVEPYDCSELKPFSSSYLQGYYAQRYDLSVEKLTDRILYTLQRYGAEAVRTSLRGYDSFSCDSCSVTPHDLQQKYALFPIWLLAYEYKGRIYQIAVNAQTGKVDGELPVDKVKRGARLVGYYFTNFLMLSPIWGTAAALLYWALNHRDMVYFLGFFAAFVLLMVAPVIVMAIETKRTDEDFGRYNVFHPVRRGINALILKRKETKARLLQETNEILGKKPSFDEYYDPAFKAEIHNEELFIGNESLFEDERK